MKTVLVTGAGGFIGRNLCDALRRINGIVVIETDRRTPAIALDDGLRDADVVYHLAGINRPQDQAEFQVGNTDLTAAICDRLKSSSKRPVVIMTSSIQAELDNPYGRSKRAAEQVLEQWANSGHGRGVVFRLKNVFGKWCRPNYNSVTATFCHNVAHGLPISISDEKRELDLVYIDDVVEALLRCLDLPSESRYEFREVDVSHRIGLGALAAKIRSFRNSRSSLELPSFEDDFTRKLYATYLSYLEGPDFAYSLDQKVDPRGSLAEFMKSKTFGQIFVSRTKPGITRGNHFHHTKTEKFLVVEGEALIRFRRVGTTEVIEHRVSGHEFRVVDIPPGYLHSIENVGAGELVTLFWACEIFDPARPDCIFESVLPQAAK